MKDIVYPLGKGSVWKNNELRYSLRSFEKFAIGIRNVYLVGEFPDWINGIINLPCKDGPNKEINIANKIYTACLDPNLSDDFIFANDDHIITQPIDLEIPNYWNMTIGAMLLRRNAGNIYRAEIERMKLF